MSTMTAPANRLNGYAPRIAPHQIQPYTVPDFTKSWDIRTLPNGWGICIRDIGPADAEKMLETMVKNQRKHIPSNVGRIAQDMESGQWVLTHQGIAFNRSGHMHDGQHRCKAVIRSGMTVPMVVFFGVGSEKEMIHTDEGVGRNVLNSAQVIGIEANSNIKSTIMTAYRQSAASTTYEFVSNSVMLTLIERYSKDAAEIERWLAGKPVKGLNRAPVKGALLIAKLSGYDVAKLERFAAIYTDSLPATLPGDNSAKLLRQFIQNNLHKGAASGSINKDLYLKACNAISQYMNGTHVTKLFSPTTAPYSYDFKN